MLHEMRLKPGAFERIAAGRKKIEFRLWDEKRQHIHPDDRIIFTNTETGKALSTYVTGIHRADSFTQLKELLIQKNLIKETDFAPSAMLKYYSREDEKRHGVVGIEIRLTGDET